MRSSMPGRLELLMAAAVCGCGGATQPVTGNARPPPEAHAAATVPRIAVETPNEPFPADVAAVLEGRIAAGVYPGVVVGLIDAHGPRVYGFGVRSLSAGRASPSNTPDRDTVYEIGSLTKVFTGVLLADMVLRGEVRLDGPVSEYLSKDVRLPVYGGAPITLVSLSTHTSGLPNLPDDVVLDRPNPFADYSVRQLYDLLARVQLSRPPGEHFAYSNVGVGLLGHALARRLGKSFEALLEERVLEVLELHDTAARPSASMTARLAIGTDAGHEVHAWDVATIDACGGLRSTARDLLGFLAAEMNQTPTRLQAAMALGREAHYRSPDGRPISGLGWGIRSQTAPELLLHEGGTGGYTTFMGMRSSGDLGVVVLTNAGFVDLADIGLRLLDSKASLRQWASITDDAALDAARAQNLIRDGDFASGPGNWGGGGLANSDAPSVRDGALCLKLQEGPTRIVGWPSDAGRVLRVRPGQRYTVLFKASASGSGPPPVRLRFNIGHHTPPYTPAGLAETDLTEQPRVYRFDFVPAQADDEVGLAFLLPRWAGKGTSDVCVDDVVVVEN